MTGRAPKILIWDVECTDMTLMVNTYELKNRIKYFNHRDIVRDWSLLGAAWKWHGEDETFVISNKCSDPLNDEGVVRALHPILEEADILVGHNSDAFDLKKFNARAMKHGLYPIEKPPRECVDTMKVAKRAKFTSNTLSYLCNYFGLELKENSPDWQAVMAGDEEAMRYMRYYNKMDVIVTEQLYDRIKCLDPRHPNLGAYLQTKDTAGQPVPVCNSCGSVELWSAGKAKNKQRTKFKDSYRCKQCNSRTVFGKWKPC